MADAGTAVRVPVLMYHRIDTNADGEDRRLCVTPARFERQLEWLAAHGFRACSLSEFRAWYRGEGRLAVGSVLITFDDGYEGLHRHALPLLQARAWPATVFLVSALVGGRDAWSMQPGQAAGTQRLLSRSQVLEMAQCDIDFHSHSRTHADLTTLDHHRLLDEVAGSRRDLEDLLGKPVDCFAYPYGRTNDAVRGAVGEAGYRLAFSVNSGFNRAGAEPLTVRRLDITGDDSPARFGRKVNMGTNDGSLSAYLHYVVKRALGRS